jgi:hypothetical protein
MSRPLKTRTTVSYIRDIENLIRLRGAIILDGDIVASNEAVNVLRAIDHLIAALRPLVEMQDEREKELLEVREKKARENKVRVA